MALGGLLIVTVSACGSAQPGEHKPPASSSAVAAVVGHQWLLTQVTASGREVDVPGSVDATFQLTADGRFLASDSVNALSGTYTATRSGFTVTHAVTTLVGYAGADPTRLAVIAAMGAVLLREGAVGAKVTASVLTLTAAGYQLSFRAAGPAVSYPPPSPTSTMTPTHR